jgi:hypothetical protein
MKLQNLFKNNMGIDKMNLNKNILHNKYLLYVIFILSFGNFFMEMMNGNMFFVAAYVLIGFLTSFFNKNMIVILSIAVIFANILKYGSSATVEGFEEESTLDKLVNLEFSTNEDEDKDEDEDEDKESKEKNKKPKEKCDLEEAEKGESEKKTKKKKEGLKQYSDEDMENMNYDKTDELIKNQEQILKHMKEYKPFLDTIQGLAKNMSTMVNVDEDE